MFALQLALWSLPLQDSLASLDAQPFLPLQDSFATLDEQPFLPLQDIFEAPALAAGALGASAANTAPFKLTPAARIAVAAARTSFLFFMKIPPR